MNLPGFSAENAIGGTGPYRLTRGAGAAPGLYPQAIPGGDSVVARCLPNFEWIWAICGQINGHPFYCRELKFLGITCS